MTIRRRPSTTWLLQEPLVVAVLVDSKDGHRALELPLGSPKVEETEVGTALLSICRHELTHKDVAVAPLKDAICLAVWDGFVEFFSEVMEQRE